MTYELLMWPRYHDMNYELLMWPRYHDMTYELLMAGAVVQR